MAIRTITDLPDISIDKIELSSNLSRSRMEISLLSNDENSIYVSRSVSCGVLTEAIAADIVKRKLVSVDNIDINGHLTLNDGISAYGDLYFNADKRYLDHEAKLNFNDVNVNSNTFKVNSNDVIGLSCGNASVTLYNDGNNGIVDIKQYGKVEHTKDENDYIVNVLFLKQKLNELSVGILNDINSGAAHIDFKVDIDFPLLGIIYIDHLIPETNTAWAIAGSSIDLNKHPKLKSYIESNQGKLRKTSGGDNDTWKYDINGNILKLPTSDWFFLSIKTGTSEDSSLSCTFKKAGLPEHSHTYISGTEKSKASFVTLVPGGGWYYGVDSQNANTGMYSFGEKTNTVQPNATKMFVYFYVGQLVS